MDKRRNLVSHRVTFLYEDGTSITGYVSACRPADGEVRVVMLSRAEITNERGELLERHPELAVVPSILVDYRITEGPSASIKNEH